MSRLAEMQKLTEDLASSLADRMAAMSALRVEVKSDRQSTREEVAACHDSRLEMAAALQRNLAEDKATRQASIFNMLASINQVRAEMAASQKMALSKATSERHVEVQNMQAGVQKAMREIHARRLADEAAVSAMLQRGRADLFQQVGSMMEDISQARVRTANEQREDLGEGRAKLAADTSSFLGETRNGRQTMAKAQRESLEAGRAQLEAEVSTAIGGFQAARVELAEDLMEFRGIWQDFAAAMQERRCGVSTPVAKSEAETNALSTAVAESFSGRTEPVPPETSKLPSDETVFAYLADYPDGLRLVDLEAYFGIPRIRLALVVNRLIEENKARKDEEQKLYFAT